MLLSGETGWHGLCCTCSTTYIRYMLCSCSVAKSCPTLCDPLDCSQCMLYMIYFAKCALSMPIINSYRKVIIKSERLKGGFFYERERYPLRPAIYSLWHLCSPKTQRKKNAVPAHTKTYTWSLPPVSWVTSGEALNCPKSQFSGPYNGMIILICGSTSRGLHLKMLQNLDSEILACCTLKYSVIW